MPGLHVRFELAMKSNPRLLFRLAITAQIAAIGQAQAETFMTSYGRPASDEEAGAMKVRVVNALSDSDSVLEVALVNGQMCGYYWLELRSLGSAFLLDLYVCPEWRGYGYGAILLARAEDETARLGATNLSLAVVLDQASAFGFYVRSGYTITGRKKRGAREWCELTKLL